MENDINEFITIVILKNGNARLTLSLHNEKNIYIKLKDFGYRISRLNGKRRLFKFEDSEVRPVSMIDIQRAFIDFIETTEFINTPKELSRSEILNWFFSKLPIKQNGLFTNILKHSLTNQETHSLLMKTDFRYKHNFEIDELVSKLNEWEFDKTIDLGSKITPNEPLYFKQVGSNKYLLFTHYNSKRKDIDGFDCWISTFKNVKDIGNKKPLELEDLRLSFHLDRDYDIIRPYLN